MSEASTVVNFPVKTKLVCEECGAPGEGSCRCGAPYVTPGARAEAAVKANPEKSDRAIADEIGVSHPTVAKARKASGGKDLPPAKRKGRDGKSYTAKRKQTGPRKLAKADQEDKARDIVRPMVAAGERIDYNKIGKQHGIAHVTVEKAARIETVLLHETTDIDSLPKTAKEKLDIAKRMIERQLNAEHAARMRALDEEVRQRVIARTAERLTMLQGMEATAQETEAQYRRAINNHQWPFTAEQFKAILMCLHPDGQRTQEKLSNAFRLFNEKKLQLTGEK